MRSLKNIKNLHKELFRNSSAFRNMAICALVIGLGDVLCVVGDLVWLVGDMSIGTHTHHWIVMSILVPALLIIVASFIWLYIGIYKYLTHHRKIAKAKKNSKKVSKKRGK